MSEPIDYAALFENWNSTTSNLGTNAPSVGGISTLPNWMPKSLTGLTTPGASGVAGPSLWDSFAGYTGEDKIQHQGWGMPAISAASGIAQAFMGWQQYKMANKFFKEDQKQFKYNANTQADLLNTQMRDRQNARVDATPGYWQNTPDYMKENEVKRYG